MPSVGITGGRPPSAIVGPLMGEKKQAPGGGLRPPPPIGPLLSETRAIKAGAASEASTLFLIVLWT